MISTIPTVSAQEYTIPSWVKGIAGFWSEGKISDNDFGEALTFLLDNNIILINPDLQSEDITSQNKIHDLEKQIKLLEIKNTRLEEKNQELENLDIITGSELSSNNDYFTEKVIQQGNEIDELKATIQKLENQKSDSVSSDKGSKDEIIALKKEIKLLRSDIINLQNENLNLELENEYLKDQLENKSEPKKPQPNPIPEPYQCPVTACSDPEIKMPQNIYYTMTYGSELPSFEINLGDTIHWKNDNGEKHIFTNGKWLINGEAYPSSQSVYPDPFISEGSDVGGMMFHTLEQDSSTSFWFKDTHFFSGQYDYRCTLHSGESATITIR